MSPESTRVLTHLRGDRDPATLPRPDHRAEPRSTVTLPKVKIHYVLLEIPMRDALAILPPALHPSVPAHVSIMIHNIEDSPAGMFRFATVGVGCRAGIRPRMLTTSAFVSSQAGRQFLSEYGRFSAELADIDMRDSYYGLDSRIAVDGQVAIDLGTFAPEPVLGAGAAVKFCAPLNPVSYFGRPSLLQVDIGFEYHETSRGRPEIRAFDPALIGPSAQTPAFGICGVRCVADMEFHGDRCLYDAQAQSEEGGMTILANPRAA